mgnify:CR=1 FL=1
MNVHTGNSVYFDNQEQKLGPEHIMASGSLPPGFPPVVIDGEHYWDGGIVSNSPLVVCPRRFAADERALIVQVDLFSARGELPVNIDQVLERAKDIQYSSKTRFNTKRVQELENLRQRDGPPDEENAPAALRDDPDYKLLQPTCAPRRRSRSRISSTGASPFDESSKDYEFSRADRPAALGSRARGRAPHGFGSRMAQGA